MSRYFGHIRLRHLLLLTRFRDGRYRNQRADYDYDPPDDFLASFDQSGNVKWAKPGYYAQIATADGGVIGQSYSGQSYTFDANGNSTGQVGNMATQSWTGNAYQYGSIDQLMFPATSLASSFAIWPWGGSNTATKQQWYPPLSSCPNTPGCNGGSVGYNEAIYNALTDLISRLNSTTIVRDLNSFPPVNTTVGGLAQTYVFNLLGSTWTTSGFIRYLTSAKPKFYNGVTSSYCSASLLPGPSLPCSVRQNIPLYQTVSEDFQNTNPLTLVDAETDTHSPGNPLLTFFRPTSILFDATGENLGNEATIFYEALHGWTQLQDLDLLEKFYPPGGQGKRICANIVHIQDYVLSPSPGLDKTSVSCPLTNP
jgi:hypothetical protein